MSELTHVLRHMLPVDDPNALVGHATGDDAAGRVSPATAQPPAAAAGPVTGPTDAEGDL